MLRATRTIFRGADSLRSSYIFNRALSTEAVNDKSQIPESVSKGSSFMQRFSSFLVGSGLGLGLGYYHLNSEIEESTATLLTAVDKLSSRIEALERKK